ncbi:helix-turn-helix domain-containing protein [Streptomyces litchfieldiae]|uniref:XRE family transcriptional regulator n=1 Tax=Streptomyces litchfieldiae TaxID=3075543 RepID=A0ABU2MLY1_9ACTN|nr:XRE family transcriptional regulator [Streptomyces sp. DSM 44938]MDT0342622.1 XRE family transcriptional regulator [Streptomyces sp. DSM 44938]
MREAEAAAESIDARLAERLAELRGERGWSLEELADRSGVSRSTLSRVERAEISPTAAMLGKLCTVYERTMSRLLSEVERKQPGVVRAGAQAVWTDPAAGFTRRSVSPPHAGLRAEVIEGVLDPGAVIDYAGPPVPGLEHHVWVLDGAVEITVGDETHALERGDCVRFRLWGSSRYHCPGPGAVRYAVVVVLP